MIMSSTTARSACQVAWDPCQGTPGRVDDHMVSSCLDHSDHLFLLHRGVVAARLAFDVAPKGAENSDIHRGNRSNFCDGSSHDNSRSDNISSGIPKANPEEDIGRGYDASIPAVFKAKVTTDLWPVFRYRDPFHENV